MFGRKPVLLIVMGLLWLTACGPLRSFPGPAATQDGSWRTIRLTQTGGFAGVHLEIQVSSEGWVTAKDQRSGRAVTSPISEGALRELNQLIAQTRLPATEHLQSLCADCFIYELEITSGAGVIRIQVDDTNLGESGARELIQFLGEIRDQALRSAS
ncbi:MAG: hypothetical protein V1755_01060 [Chloroflexota bacterium]